MTLGEVVSQALFPLVFLGWAEFRFLPLVRLAIGWSVAHATKAGVTAAQAAKHAPPL